MARCSALVLVALSLISLHATVAVAKPKPEPRLTLQRLGRVPKDGRPKLTPVALAALRLEVKNAPRDRGKRFDLVKGLVDAGLLSEALQEAKAWRAKDAYNLVVVRMIGDLLAELGDLAGSRRAYSAVVELLPQDPEAQRALATVMRQSGDVQGAYDRLLVAARLRPSDLRIAFELADAAHRLGHDDEAVARFEEIKDKGRQDISYPARQRLTQLYAARRRDAEKRGDQVKVAELKKTIDALGVKGGAVNDIKVYLTWDTDRTDVDLWVTNPAGEKVFYSHKVGRFDEELFYDVTSGYGPESFTAHQAAAGSYVVEVNFYNTSRQTFTEARGEVTVILGEGTEREERHVLPYRLFRPKQTVAVARIVAR